MQIIRREGSKATRAWTKRITNWLYMYELVGPEEQLIGYGDRLGVDYIIKCRKGQMNMPHGQRKYAIYIKEGRDGEAGNDRQGDWGQFCISQLFKMLGKSKCAGFVMSSVPRRRVVSK